MLIYSIGFVRIKEITFVFNHNYYLVKHAEREQFVRRNLFSKLLACDFLIFIHVYVIIIH